MGVSLELYHGANLEVVLRCTNASAIDSPHHHSSIASTASMASFAVNVAK